MPPPGAARRPGVPVVLIGSATAFSLLGDQVLYAVLPVYYERLGLGPIQVGILLSANRWIRLLTNELAHRVRGSRWLFGASFLLGAATTCAYALTTSFLLLVTARLAWGLAWSFIRHLGIESVMAATPDDRAARTMGVYNGISRAGSVAGLLGGALLVDVFGFAAGVLMLGLVSLAAVPLGVRGYGSTGAAPKRTPGAAPAALLIAGLVVGAVGPGFVMGTLGATLSGYVGASGWYSAATLTGLLLASRYVLDTLAAPWLGAAADRLGLARAAAGFFAAGGAALLVAAAAPPIWLFVAAVLGFFACGTGLQAGLTARASRLGSGPFARYASAVDLGAAAGPLLGWLVVATLGNPAWALAIGGLLCLVAVPPARRIG